MRTAAMRAWVGTIVLALIASGCASDPDDVVTTGVERLALPAAPTTTTIEAIDAAAAGAAPTLPPAAIPPSAPAPTATPTTSTTSPAAADPSAAPPPTARPTTSTTTPSAPTTTTTLASPTTTPPTTTLPTGGCCGEGRLKLFVTAKSVFDQWTSGGHWDWIDAHYDSMVVWEPYWDSRLASYDRVTVYRDAYAIKTNTAKDSRSVDHPDWVLRTAAGDPVYIPFACGNGCPQYAADVGNQAFIDDWIGRVREYVDTGYRGLFIDDVNYLWRFSDVTGNTDIEPIDPRTGAPLTLEDWQRYMTEFMEQVRAAFPQLEIWHNPIWYADSPSFDNDLVDRQIRAADVIQLERGMNDLGITSGTGRYGMRTFMAFIDRVHANGAAVALLDENAVDLQGQWYNIAGGLLVSNGTTYVTTEDWDLIAPGRLFEGYLTDLGDALGPRRVVDGTIQRNFTSGLVIMNEPTSPEVTVDLGGTWLAPDGRPVTSITLAPREAVVLTHP